MLTFKLEVRLSTGCPGRNFQVEKRCFEINIQQLCHICVMTDFHFLSKSTNSPEMDKIKTTCLLPGGFYWDTLYKKRYTGSESII